MYAADKGDEGTPEKLCGKFSTVFFGAGSSHDYYVTPFFFPLWTWKAPPVWRVPVWLRHVGETFGDICSSCLQLKARFGPARHTKADVPFEPRRIEYTVQVCFRGFRYPWPAPNSELHEGGRHWWMPKNNIMNSVNSGSISRIFRHWPSQLQRYRFSNPVR